MAKTRSQARTPSTNPTVPPGTPGTPEAPGTPVSVGHTEPDLEAPMVPIAPPAVQPTDPVLPHALRLVGFDQSRTPDHPVFQ